MLTINRSRQTTCEGLSRRTLLEAGGAGLLGLSLPRVLAAESGASPATGGRARSVIFLFLFGGPSQLETFDLKPDAPEKIRGPFRPTPSRTPGLLVSEPLEKCAAISDRLAVIRTMSHGYNDHSGASHYIQTGHPWHIPIGGGFNVTSEDWPSMGSFVKYLRAAEIGAARAGSTYAVVPNFLGRLQEYNVQLRRPGETAGWLGRAFDPLTTRIDKRDAKDNPYFRECLDSELQFAVDGLQLEAGMTVRRLTRRQTLLEQLNEARRLADRHRAVEDMDQFRRQVLELVTSPAMRNALDVTTEDGRLRDGYGRNLFGQSTLVARRLVEAGVRFVTVHYDAVDGYSWDSHQHSQDVERHLLPGLDHALSSLVLDLEDRGLLDETLVVALGEMGRTPQANNRWGRNHWSTLFPAVLAGGGIRGGVVYGESDSDAAYAVTPPVRPEDLAATILHAMGIDPTTRIPDPAGRPHAFLSEGRPLLELFG